MPYFQTIKRSSRRAHCPDRTPAPIEEWQEPDNRFPEFRNSTRQLFSITDIARLCNVKLDTVSRWIRFHNLRMNRNGFVTRQHLIEFIKSSQRGFVRANRRGARGAS